MYFSVMLTSSAGLRKSAQRKKSKAQTLRDPWKHHILTTFGCLSEIQTDIMYLKILIERVCKCCSLFASLPCSDDADIVISLSWCIRANKAGRAVRHFKSVHRLVYVNPPILLVCFYHGWCFFFFFSFFRSHFKVCTSRKTKILKFQSHRMIDSWVELYYSIWCGGTEHWSQTSTPTHNMFDKCSADLGLLK